MGIKKKTKNPVTSSPGSATRGPIPALLPYHAGMDLGGRRQMGLRQVSPEQRLMRGEEEMLTSTEIQRKLWSPVLESKDATACSVSSSE